MRLDVYLQTYYPDISRAQLQKMIKNGQVTVNGEPERKNGAKLGEDDAVSIDFSAVPEQSEAIEIPVIYEDKDCVVIDKPIGVLTHSKGEFNPEPTVASWLESREGFDFPKDDSTRSGIVHRLDRATSGVMICAKNQPALKHLQKQFQDKKAKKTYIARVTGEVEPAEAVIDVPIERNPKQPQRFRAGRNGKTAQTAYKIIGRVGQDTLLELMPATGRTHQLRVHLDYIKHPIIGDTFYDGKPAERLFLHAQKLEITLPNKSRQTFEANLPTEFNMETT